MNSKLSFDGNTVLPVVIKTWQVELQMQNLVSDKEKKEENTIAVLSQNIVYKKLTQTLGLLLISLV